MAEFLADVRDVKFVLFDQVGIHQLFRYPQFQGLDRDTIDALVDGAYKLARQVMAPVNQEIDRRGATYDKATSQVRVPSAFHEIHEQFCGNGWLSLSHNPAYGGQGMPVAVEVAVGHFFFGACLSFNLWPLLTVGVAHLIDVFGTDELKRLYLERLYRGAWSGTMCLTEPGAGSDVGGVRTKARKAGGHYLIEGEKIFITFGEHDLTDQICHAVLARIEGAPAGTRGLSLFLVPKYRVAADGSLGEGNDVRCAGIERKMGIHGSPTCTMVFGEKGDCRGWLLGEEHKGMRAMFQMMNEARVLVGLQGAALANAAYQHALQFAKERVQGKELRHAKDEAAPGTAIVNHPDVRRMLMWQKAIAEGSRALLVRTAFFGDVARATDDPAERDTYQGLIDLLTPVCKAYASDMGSRSIELSMQTLGGYGYVGEYPVEQYLRDAKIASIYEGTNGIQALDLIGRKTGQQGGAPLRALIGMISSLVDRHSRDPLLGPEMRRLAAARDAFAELASYFAAAGARDPYEPALNATPFLEVAGQVVLGWLLLEQAAIGLPRLAGICTQKGVTLADEQAVATLCTGDEEARYYLGKVKVAQFWARRVLQLVRARADILKSGDRSPLEAPL